VNTHRTRAARAAVALSSVAVAAAMLPPTAAQAASDPGAQTNNTTRRLDNRPGPLSQEVAAKRAKALELVAAGKAKLNQRAAGGAVVRVGAASADDPSAFVEFPRDRTDKIWTVLSEFGTQTDKAYGGAPGPLHNEIEEPDRDVDNSTVWEKDFSKAYYDSIFNGSSNETMQGFYEEQSGGRYSVNVTTEDWVKLPYNGAYYGSNPREDEGGAWAYVDDTVDTWYANAKASGKTDAQIKEHLSQFDVWDRYDADSDGNFNEPDGYIDHFQAVHAGEGEEGNGGADAIWSHRWYVNDRDYGATGPTVGGQENLLGGAEIGNTGIWVGDYTVEPENGGLGVFAHEYGHDLNLPDFYDTAGGENSTAFWTVMSSGSWLSYGADTGIGTHANGFGPDEKYFLGWLDYSTVKGGETKQVVLGPSAHTYDGADQAVMVELPDKPISTTYTTPASGSYAWWSNAGDDLNTRLTASATIPRAKSINVTAKASYAIEKNYDYLYAEYSTDNGVHWKKAGAVTGDSGGKWTTLRFSYPGDTQTRFRFRYDTDGGYVESGAFLDDIVVKAGKQVVARTGAEDSDSGWVPNGFIRSDGTAKRIARQYYWLESRQYVGADATLENGPYQFSKGYTAPNWVEHFPFQNGMLVWFQDKRYLDNNTINHVGYGQSLPVDAVAAPFYYEGTTAKPSNRRQPFDATFGLEQVDPVCLHREVLSGHGTNQQVVTQAACAPTGTQQAQFNDSNVNRYWSADNPLGSTKVAGLGVTATVLSDANGFLTVRVVNPAP
jgi:immune inhibitor A